MFWRRTKRIKKPYWRSYLISWIILIILCLLTVDSVFIFSSNLEQPIMLSFVGFGFRFLFMALTGGPGNTTSMLLLAFITFLIPVLLCLIFSWPILLIGAGLIRSMHKNKLKKSTYKVIQDIDYYREILDGVSPGVISLMMDLNVENKKDIAATLLSLEMKGYLSVENGSVQFLNSNKPLFQSEKVLLESLKSGGFAGFSIFKWREAVHREAVDAGLLISNKDKGRALTKSLVCAACFFLCMCLVNADVFPGFATMNQALAEMEEIAPYIEVDENGVVGGGNVTKEDLEAAGFRVDFDIGETLDTEEEVFYVSLSHPAAEKFLVAASGLFLYLLAMFFCLFGPFYCLGTFIGYKISKPKYKRSSQGEALTEYIAAMKNFIHDFGSLNEHDKRALAVWDYFLVYAVVMEENDVVVQEIGHLSGLKVDFESLKKLGGTVYV